MNFYQFLKTIQEEVGCGCQVSMRLWNWVEYASGLEISVDWPDDLHYRFVVLEKMLDNGGLLEELCKYVIDTATRAYCLATIGEE